MRKRDGSLLGYALLGLIGLLQPCSGYDLRRLFTARPMATFSDSPGSIYPALKRLERSRAISGTVDAASPLRRRKLYRLSAKGKGELERWLRRPVKSDDVVRGMPELMLRFSFLDDCLGPAACRPFLESLSVALDSYAGTLREHLKSNQADMSRSARLALGSGIMGYERQAEWARMALKEYRRPNLGRRRPRGKAKKRLKGFPQNL